MNVDASYLIGAIFIAGLFNAISTFIWAILLYNMTHKGD